MSDIDDDFADLKPFEVGSEPLPSDDLPDQPAGDDDDFADLKPFEVSSESRVGEKTSVVEDVLAGLIDGTTLNYGGELGNAVNDLQERLVDPVTDYVTGRNEIDGMPAEYAGERRPNMNQWYADREKGVAGKGGKLLGNLTTGMATGGMAAPATAMGAAGVAGTTGALADYGDTHDAGSALMSGGISGLLGGGIHKVLSKFTKAAPAAAAATPEPVPELPPMKQLYRPGRGKVPALEISEEAMTLGAEPLSYSAAAQPADDMALLALADDLGNAVPTASRTGGARIPGVAGMTPPTAPAPEPWLQGIGDELGAMSKKVAPMGEARTGIARTPGAAYEPSTYNKLMRGEKGRIAGKGPGRLFDSPPMREPLSKAPRPIPVKDDPLAVAAPDDAAWAPLVGGKRAPGISDPIDLPPTAPAPAPSGPNLAPGNAMPGDLDEWYKPLVPDLNRTNLREPIARMDWEMPSAPAPAAPSAPEPSGPGLGTLWGASRGSPGALFRLARHANEAASGGAPGARVPRISPAGMGATATGLGSIAGQSAGPTAKAYATQATMGWTLQAVLSSGNSGLPPEAEQRLTEAVVAGDDSKIIAANFQLQQKYPAYAKRVEDELRALNQEG